MAKSKGGCLGFLMIVGTFMGLCFALIPMFKTFTAAGIQKFCMVCLVVSIVVFLVGIIMGCIYKKPEYEDESFGHMLKRWLFGAIAACAMGAIAFSIAGIGKLKEFGTDVQGQTNPAHAQESTLSAAE